MPVITREAIQWMQDELESVTSQRDELEEELATALEEVKALRGQLAILRADRRYEVSEAG